MPAQVKPSPLAQHLGHLLGERRRERGLTQAQLSERADVSQKYYGEIERGVANVTVEALAKIATALDWDPWTLFSTKPPPITQGTHQVLLSDLSSLQERIQSTVDWLAALDPTQRRL